jgi:hypothetical protein
MPQPPSHQPSLSSGQQFLYWPLHLLLHGPFIHPMHFCILLHFKCKLLHSCSYLIELQIHLWIVFFLRPSLRPHSWPSVAISTFYLPSWKVYGLLYICEHLHLLSQLTWLFKILLLHPCNNLLTEHQYSAFLSPLVYKKTLVYDTT